MKLKDHEIHEVLEELTPFYYQYKMLDSVLHKTEKESEEMEVLKKKLVMYHKQLYDAFPFITSITSKEKTELYLRKLERVFTL